MKQFLRTIVWSGAIAACLLAQNQGNGNSGASKGKGNTTAPGNSGNAGNAGNSGNSTGTAAPGNSGAASSNGNSSMSSPTIEWLVPETATAQELLDTGTSTVEFKSSVDLENVAVWLTPSLQGLTADPVEFATIDKDTIYSIELTLEAPPTHTLGGTLHLRATNGRSLARPLPINIKVKGDTEETDPILTAVVSSTSYQSGSITAGETVSLFGKGLGPQNGKTRQLDENGLVANYLGDTQVLFNGIPAPVLSTSSGQVNAIVPQDLAADTTASIVVTFKGKVSPTVTLPVTPAAPALFTLDGSGQGQGAALNQDGTVNSTSNRAPRGSIVILYGSGFGAWSTPVPDGTVIGSELPTPKAPVTVTIGGAAAKVLYAGGAPGMVSGVVQINAEIPATITPGDKVTVVVSVGNQSSPANVTVSVQ